MYRWDRVKVRVQRVDAGVSQYHADAGRLLDGGALVYASIRATITDYDLSRHLIEVEQRRAPICK